MLDYAGVTSLDELRRVMYSPFDVRKVPDLPRDKWNAVMAELSAAISALPELPAGPENTEA
jgi:hypothetical protein